MKSMHIYLLQELKELRFYACKIGSKFFSSIKKKTKKTKKQYRNTKNKNSGQ